MKIFRWILSNILLLVVVWTLVYVYLNWDEVQHDMPESVTNMVAKFQQQYGKPAESTAVESTAVESTAVESTAVKSPVVEHEMQAELGQPETTSTEPEVVRAEETGRGEVVVEEPTPIETSESITSIAVESPEVTALAEPETTETNPATEEGAPQLDEIAPAPLPRGIAAAGSVQKHELDEIVKNELIQAREAFWHRDLAKAETLYTELTAKQADNPDIWGELGNVYLAQNKVKEAADAYYKAAEILIDEGRLRQVGQLMGVIQMAEPAKAQALDQKIRKLYQQTGTMR